MSALPCVRFACAICASIDEYRRVLQMAKALACQTAQKEQGDVSPLPNTSSVESYVILVSESHMSIT